jgi:hypothetical protein
LFEKRRFCRCPGGGPRLAENPFIFNVLMYAAESISEQLESLSQLPDAMRRHRQRVILRMLKLATMCEPAKQE